MSKYNFGNKGEQIESILQNSFTSVSRALGDRNFVLTFTTATTPQSVTIPMVNINSAGLMTPSMYVRLAEAEKNALDAKNDGEKNYEILNEKFSSISGIATRINLTNEESRCTAVFVDKEGNRLYQMIISSANFTQAGLMTPDMLKKQNTSALIYVAQKVNGVAISTIPLVIRDPDKKYIKGTLCYDYDTDMLALLFEGVYYKTWQKDNDPNGIGSSEYKGEYVIIVSEGKMFKYDLTNQKWGSVGFHRQDIPIYDDEEVREKVFQLEGDMRNAKGDIDNLKGVTTTLSEDFAGMSEYVSGLKIFSGLSTTYFSNYVNLNFVINNNREVSYPLSVATQEFAGVMSASDKRKLDSIDVTHVDDTYEEIMLLETVFYNFAFCDAEPSSGETGMDIAFRTKRNGDEPAKTVKTITIPFAEVIDGTSSYGLMPRNTLYEHQVIWDWLNNPVDGEIASTHPESIAPDSAALVIREANRMGQTSNPYNSQAPRIGFNWDHLWWGQMIFVQNTFKFVRGADDTKWAGLQAGDAVFTNVRVSDGTANQFMKADGSLDNAEYAQVLNIAPYCRKGASVLPSIAGKVLKYETFAIMHHSKFDHNAEGPVMSIDAFCYRHVTEEYIGKRSAIEIFFNNGYLMTIRVSECKLDYLCYIDASGKEVRIDENYVEGSITYARLLSIANRAIGELGEGLYLKVKDLDEKTNIVEMGVGKHDASHRYDFSYEITQGKGVLFKIHYEHGRIPRSLQPRIVCYSKGDGSTVWNQPFRCAYIDQSGWGNPTECVPYFYGQRTQPLSGTGDIYIFMAFADEPETYLDYDMEAYVNLEYSEALLPFDSEKRTLPHGGRFDINKQDVIFADETINAASGSGNVRSGESGVPLRFWAKAGKRITSISFSTENWKPIGQVKNPTNGQYTYTISGYNVPTDQGEHPLVTIDWLIESASKDINGTIDVTGVAKLSIPFSLHVTSGNALMERVTELERQLSILNKKLLN